MISKKVVFILMLLGFSVSSFAQQHAHQQAGAQVATEQADQHGDGAMAGGGKNGHGEMSMKMQQGGSHGAMSMNVSHTRHHFARDYGIAEPYEGMESPLAEGDVDLGRAQSLYQDNCADCHGVQGQGDGPGGAGLDPAPTDIARFAKMKMAKDDYLYWTIAEGGVPLASDMPAFKNVLSSDEIWQIVGYLRQLQN